MFARPVRITLTTCVRHLRHRPATALRVPLKTHVGQLQRHYATPPAQVNHRWVPGTFTLKARRADLWDSDLTVERYHALSDATMDTLWESLEELLDVEGNSNYEVEYSVRCNSGPHDSSRELLFRCALTRAEC